MKTIFAPYEIKIGHLYKSNRNGVVFENALYLGCITPKHEKFLVVVQADNDRSSIGRMVLNNNNLMWDHGFVELEHILD